MRSEKGLFVLGLLCFAPAARAEVIENILAVVDGRPVLLSEVRAVERVRGLDRPRALEETIDERLMYREAARLPQSLPTREEEEKAISALWERDPALREDVTEGELRRLVRRQATTVKYIRLRFSPQVRVGEEEVRQAYQAEYEGRGEAPALEAVAEDLRLRLVQKALDERIEAWVSELRAAAEVRYNR